MNNFYKFVDGIKQDPIYICDPNKSPCKNSDICYQPGGCFHTTDKDRALDPYTPLYTAESLYHDAYQALLKYNQKKVNKEAPECQISDQS